VADERQMTVAGREVIEYLVSNTGKVVMHRAPLQAAWSFEATEQIDYLRVFINQLRGKIEPVPRHP
jgi:two-component system KDP operon response regulator KdpE